MWLKPQTVDKPMLPKFDTHGESARGDRLFPLAIDILKKFLIFKLSTLCRQLEVSTKMWLKPLSPDN